MQKDLERITGKGKRTNGVLNLKVFFSRHARRQMKWRKITENEARLAIDEPDNLEQTVKRTKECLQNRSGQANQGSL